MQYFFKIFAKKRRGFRRSPLKVSVKTEQKDNNRDDNDYPEPKIIVEGIVFAAAVHKATPLYILLTRSVARCNDIL